MHQALQLDEILRIIFGNFIEPFDCPTDDDYGPRVESQDLLNLALTCSAFKEPSLDTLWMTLFSLDPLLHLFPKDAIAKFGGRWRVRRDLSVEDWVAVGPYSHRVRRLTFGCFTDLDEDYSTSEESDRSTDFSQDFFAKLHHFASVHNTHPILPALKSVFVTPGELPDLDCVPLFVTSPLKVLSIDTYSLLEDCNHDYVHPFRESLENPGRLTATGFLLKTFRAVSLARMASVQRLKLPILFECHPSLLPDIETSFIQMLRSIPNLQSLSIGGNLLKLHKVAVCVGQMPELRELELTGPVTASFGTGVLTKLRVLSAELHNLQHLLGSLDGRSPVVRIECHDEDHQLLPIECLAVAEALSEKCPKLQNLRMSLWTDGFIFLSQESPWESMSFLSPFARCKCLTSIRLEFDELFAWSLINLTADEYLTLFQNWPQLEDLRVATYTRGNMLKVRGLRPRASLQDLLEPLARYCQRIRTVTWRFAFLWDFKRIRPKKKFAWSFVALDVQETHVMLEDEGRVPVGVLVNKAQMQLQCYLTTLTNKDQSHLRIKTRDQSDTAPGDDRFSLLALPSSNTWNLVACYFSTPEA